MLVELVDFVHEFNWFFLHSNRFCYYIRRLVYSILEVVFDSMQAKSCLSTSLFLYN